MGGDARAARHLARQAGTVSQVSGRDSCRAVLRRIADAVLDRSPRSQVASGWWDTASQERPGWRERAANLDADIVFSIDYRSCRRCGLASAGLAALRAEHPDLNWHTLGGHLTESQAFWAVVGTGVPGGYQQRHLCSHVRLD